MITWWPYTNCLESENIVSIFWIRYKGIKQKVCPTTQQGDAGSKARWDRLAVAKAKETKQQFSWGLEGGDENVSEHAASSAAQEKLQRGSCGAFLLSAVTDGGGWGGRGSQMIEAAFVCFNFQATFYGSFGLWIICLFYSVLC